MKRNALLLLLISVSFIANGYSLRSEKGVIQSGNIRSKEKTSSSMGTVHDLGLHGVVTWLSETKVRVEYDWSDESQLLDWTTTNGSTLVRGNGSVTVTGGVTSVRSMIWIQFMKCSRIYAQDAKAINSSRAHLNFITNVVGWTGSNYNPPEMIGLIYVSDGNLWLENGAIANLPGPVITLGKTYTVDVNVSETAITAKSSSDNVLYSHTLATPPDNDRQVAIGGWGGDTQWGKLIIEGEINPVLTPSDMINFQSGGATFSPVIEVVGSPTIEWIFDDATTSASTTPTKNYGSIGSRHNYLRVTPWSALVGINVGYDAGDGGYGDFASVANQNISQFQNLILAKSNLQYLCASYSPLTKLDLRQLTALKFVELFLCHNLQTLQLDTHPVLERLCVEDCNIAYLDLSGCAGLKDLRAASNLYKSINWGLIGQVLWHICVRSNDLTTNLPSLTQFPVLKELLTWDDNQTGAFVCHSPIIQRIDSYDNHYTSADISGCSNLTQFSLSGSQLSSLDLGTANSLTDIHLKDCGLTESHMDYILKTLDIAGRSNGFLDLTINTSPSAAGIVHYNNLKGKGWTILIPNSLVTSISVTGTNGETSITSDNGTLQLSASVLPSYATDKTVTWSIVNGTDQATISTAGLVTAVENGSVTVRATANDNSGIYGTLIINISNQIIHVNGITVTGTGNATTITDDKGTLQLIATILPSNATNKTVTWSLVTGTGLATISATGLVTAVNNGTITAKATANDGAGIYGTLVVVIYNQKTSVSSIIVAGERGATTITTIKGTLQLSAEVLPSNATDKTVTWSLVAGTGLATISTSGLVTAIKNGTISARATANDRSGVYGILDISIAIEKLELPKLLVTDDEIKILLDEDYISGNVGLYNLLGTQVMFKIVNSYIVILDISYIPPGIYILVLSNGEILKVEKVIK